MKLDFLQGPIKKPDTTFYGLRPCGYCLGNSAIFVIVNVATFFREALVLFFFFALYSQRLWQSIDYSRASPAGTCGRAGFKLGLR